MQTKKEQVLESWMMINAEDAAWVSAGDAVRAAKDAAWVSAGDDRLLRYDE